GLLGVGRLEADAWVHRAYGGPVLPVHAAGRGDYAWALFEMNGEPREVTPATISPADLLIARAPERALICGEVTEILAEMARRERPDLRIVTGPAHQRRAITIAAPARRPT